MSKMIQIRNVPERLHRTLKMRAARHGMTLSDYLLREIAQVAAKPEVQDVIARIRARGETSLSEDPVTVLRAERDRSLEGAS